MAGNIKKLLSRANMLDNKKNANVINRYYTHLNGKGGSLLSQVNNLQTVFYFARYIGETNLSDVKEKHQVLDFLNTFIKNDDPEKRWTATYNIYLLRLITFYRWFYNCDDDKGQEYWTTPNFMNIKKKQTNRLSPYNGTEIWDKEELQSIIKYEISIRNKAIISLLWDLDARPHEITLLKIKHIRLREKYGEGEIPFTAKTGSGPILLTFSFPYLRDWLNKHPDKNNANAYLISKLTDGTSISTMLIYFIMTRLRDRIKRLVITGKITDQREKERLEYFLNTKKWNPYCIRHSSITADSDYLPEYALKKKVRWSMNSQQGRRYIKNRMGDELRNKILEQNGIILDTDLKPKPTNTICPRCELVNQIENKYCSKCSYPLSPQAFDDIKSLEDEKINALKQKNEQDISTLKQEMEQRFQQLLDKIDLQNLS